MTCHRHESGVAWFGWVDVVVDVLGGDGGGGKEEETMGQRLNGWLPLLSYNLGLSLEDAIYNA